MPKTFKGCSEVAMARRRKSFCSQPTPWNLRWSPVCSSTEILLTSWLRENPWEGNLPRAWFAGRQLKGVGQHGRSWKSPNGGVWVSAAIPWSVEQKSPGLLGLTIAVALAERLELYGLPVRIKWPNDIFLNGRKLAGFLPRLIHRGSQLRLARIGLGLNVWNHVPSEGVSLSEILLPGQCDRANWMAEVLIAFDRALTLANSPIRVCKEVEIRLLSKTICNPIDGKYWDVSGIDTDGSLKLKRGIKETSNIKWNL